MGLCPVRPSGRPLDDPPLARTGADSPEYFKRKEAWGETCVRCCAFLMPG